MALAAGYARAVLRSRWWLVLCTGMLAIAPRVARGEDIAPPPVANDNVKARFDALARVAPAIVKVRRGEWWGSGVVFGSRRTVVTSFTLVNGPGELQVVGADGVSRAARVLNWSPKDDLVVLTLDVDVAEPIRAAPREPSVGMAVALVYEPRDPELRADVSGDWTPPLPRSTYVSRVLPTEVDLDLSILGTLGDDGAPVLSETGELVGVISRRSAGERRTILTPVARLEWLLAQPRPEAAFSPAHASGHLFDLFVTPLYETIFDQQRQRTTYFGAGLEDSYHYGSVFALFSLGLYGAGAHQLSATTSESLDRLQLDLVPGAEFRIVRPVDVFFGPGLSLVVDSIETTTVNDAGALHASQGTRARARPILVFGLTEGPFFVRDVWTLSSPAEVRLDLGYRFGSQTF